MADETFSEMQLLMRRMLSPLSELLQINLPSHLERYVEDTYIYRKLLLS